MYCNNYLLQMLELKQKITQSMISENYYRNFGGVLMSKEDISQHVPAFGVIASWVRYCPDKQDQLPAYLEEALTLKDVLSSPEHLQAFRKDLTKWRTSDENSWPIGVRNM